MIPALSTPRIVSNPSGPKTPSAASPAFGESFAAAARHGIHSVRKSPRAIRDPA